MNPRTYRSCILGNKVISITGVRVKRGIRRVVGGPLSVDRGTYWPGSVVLSECSRTGESEGVIKDAELS